PPSGRPKGFEGGIDFDYDLTRTGQWTWLAELGGVHFISSDPNQLNLSSGLQWSPTEMLSFSAILLCGLSKGSDPYGALIGISPTAYLYR
ncbi:MAG TPA: hypothetical protein VIV60_09280, partial [Polyangiaceae bacterium]